MGDPARSLLFGSLHSWQSLKGIMSNSSAEFGPLTLHCLAFCNPEVPVLQRCFGTDVCVVYPAQCDLPPISHEALLYGLC